MRHYIPIFAAALTAALIASIGSYAVGWDDGYAAGYKAATPVQARHVPHRIIHTYAVATAYCDVGNTASGVPTHRGVVAVDPRVVQLGSDVFLNGHRYLAADTGGAIKWHRPDRSSYADVDIWMDSCDKALNWGRRVVRFDVYAKG